jgi:hypothetical protein
MAANDPSQYSIDEMSVGSANVEDIMRKPTRTDVRRVKNSSQRHDRSPAFWGYPCDREDVRALISALLALERLRGDEGVRIGEYQYLAWRNEFWFGPDSGSAPRFHVEPTSRKRTRRKAA